MGCNRVVIGIDVGKSGGFCAIDADSHQIIDHISMPTIGKEYDINAMLNFILKYKTVHVAIEDVHAVQIAGRSTSFQFGMGKGILIGIVHSMDIPYTLVQAKAWQKVAWEGVSKQVKGGKTDTKSMSLIAANRLFPSESFLASPRCKKPHDGIVDASLIAYYIKQKINL